MKYIILAEPTTLVLGGLLLMFFVVLAVFGVVALFVYLFRKTKSAAPPAPPLIPPFAQGSFPKCPKCGAPLPPDSPEGLCPRCLIALRATQTEITGEPGAAKPPPAPPLPVADVAKLFPQLEILECLGRGGMGTVYKARQPRLDRIIALKVLSPEKQGNQKFAERFEREARALAKLHHPNIVTVYDFGTVGQASSLSETDLSPVLHYLLMEFVDGLTLRQLLQARKLSPDEALAIVPKICEALQYAHEQGIIHRDIKPENILMDKEGRVKIADFGIAKILGDGGRENLTEEQAIGTPHYMSPEQIEKPRTVDHRADIYSLGVVFYEMLTGELPLGNFQPPSQKVHIDVRLDAVVLRALEKEPERRYQQASEVKTQVETIAATPQSGSPASRDESAPSKSQSQFASTVPPAFSWTLMQFVTLGCGLLFICLVLLLGISSNAISAETWSYFRLGFEVLAAAIFVAFLFVVYRAIKTNTPESWRAVKTWVPALVIMAMGILFGFWSPHLLQPKADTAPSGVTLSEAAFFQKFDSNQISHATITYPSVSGGAATINGKIFETDKDGKIVMESGKPVEESFVAPNVVLTSTMKDKLLTSNRININIPNPMISNIGYQLLFFVLFPVGVLLVFGIGIYVVWRVVKKPSEASIPPVHKPDHFWRWFAVTVLALISVPLLIAFLGLLAAIAIPAFVQGRQHAIELREQQLAIKSEEEAADESRASWITNVPPASAETWSPTFAPGTKPDMSKILEEAKDLIDGGNYEGALQRLIWYYNHALEYDQGQTGVRLSFALDDWIELGRDYPKAKQALIEIRDRDTEKLLNSNGSFNMFMDVHGINQYLGDNDATYALFKTIEARDPQLAGECYFVVESQLAEKGEYETCRKYMGDPQFRFQTICIEYEMELQSQKEEEEIRRRARQLVEHNRPPGETNTFGPPDTSTMMKRAAEDRFVGQVRQLIQILVATGGKSNAENIQKQALAVLDDPRLESAVEDAGTKIEKQNRTEDALQILAEQPPVIVETFPVSGARDVEPGEIEIRVRFSKDMMNDSWSWSTAWENSAPDFIGVPHYEADSRTCVAKAKLEPGRTYAFWLNSGNFHNFKDKDGVPAVPYLLIFQTKQN